jgi:hypothetical protein
MKSQQREEVLLYLAEIVFQDTTKILGTPVLESIEELLGGGNSVDDPAASKRLWDIVPPPGFPDYCRVTLRKFRQTLDEGKDLTVNGAVALALLHLAADTDLYEKCVFGKRITDD